MTDHATLTHRFDAIRALLASFAPVPVAEWRFFESHLSERTFRRGEHLQRADRPVTQLYFIADGLVRNYLLDGDGEERTTGFVFAGDLAGDYSSAVVTRTAAAINIDALRPTRAFVFPSSILLALYERHACWDRIGRAIVERQVAKREDKERRFRRFTPEEHYHYLLAHKPHLPAQVPLRYVASYLGIRPETLSRIRRRSKSGSPNAPKN
jgi:CRP-like cAMP-binding protein